MSVFETRSNNCFEMSQKSSLHLIFPEQFLQSALKTETRRRKEAEKNVMELSRVKLSRSEWERCACLSCDEEKLIVDLIRLFKTGVSKTNPVQMTVIQNLTSRLSKRSNNHFVELIKDISGLFRNELGSTNYSLLADMFGLTGNTTASNHDKEERLDAGIKHKYSKTQRFVTKAYQSMRLVMGHEA